ncbi:MAG: creatininase family protein [Bryobacterales bacterium]|nr:creatininase family protein [Bryobacterales bacterium]
MRAAVVLLAAAAGWAQTPDPMRPDPNMPRPVAVHDSVFLEELTWLEVRDAQRAGKTTAIVATGGIEMNGPYLALGKHNYILRATTEAIARKLGSALVAPIVAFVPEGDLDPPTQHMLFPGSISLREETFQALLTDIAASLKTGGFRDIVFLADSGGNVKGMQAVAAKLTREWKGAARVHYIAEYYDYPGAARFAEETLGVKQVPEGHHDDYVISTQMMTVDPLTVRMEQRRAKGLLKINGASLEPPRSIEHGRRIVNYRAERAAAAIRKVVAASGTRR